MRECMGPVKGLGLAFPHPSKTHKDTLWALPLLLERASAKPGLFSGAWLVQLPLILQQEQVPVSAAAVIKPDDDGGV